MKTISAIQSEFPALSQKVNGNRLAYLDNAATTQRPIAVLEAMDSFYRNDNANVHRGVHTLSMRATEKFELARHQVARFINSPADELVIFTKGCTEAINLVAGSWGRANLREGDIVLVSEMEHHSNIVPWQMVCQETKARISPIQVQEPGVLDLTAFRELLQQGNVKLVCVKHVCNAIGTVNPIKEMAALAHKFGALIMVDGAQALAHENVDVQDLEVDFYAMAAHKVYGPMGIGALYCRREILEKMAPYQTGGGMIQIVTFESTSFAPLPDRFEPGTPNVAGAIGFGAALEWVKNVGIDEIKRGETNLLDFAVAELNDVPGLSIIGNAPGKAGIISFVNDYAHPHDVGTILDSEGVAVRSGHHCCQPLLARFKVPATTRASLAAYSTQDDINALAKALLKVNSVFG